MSNIFEIAIENSNLVRQLERLNKLVSQKNIVVRHSYTSSNYDLLRLTDCAFYSWKGRGIATDSKDFLELLELDRFQQLIDDNQLSQINKDELERLTKLYLEAIYNLLMVANYGAAMLRSNCYEVERKHLVMIEENIKYALDYLNLNAKVIDEIIYLYPKELALELLAEKQPEDITNDMIKYLHIKTKGDLFAKKKLLTSLARYLESYGKEYKNDADLRKLGHIFNNFDLRHNNVDEGSKNYKNQIAKLSNDELEKWYDVAFYRIVDFLIKTQIKEMEKPLPLINELMK